MKQALLLLTAGLILVGGVFVFAERVGLTDQFTSIVVSFMNVDAADDPVIIPANPDGTCDPGFHWKGDGYCESDPGLFDEDEDEEVDGAGEESGGIDWFFPEGGFVPCGKRGGDGIAIAEPCNICHAAELGQNILNFLVLTVMPFLAILFAAIGGFQIMTAGGNENSYRAGRDQLVRVAIGILIVLLAWAGINFVMSTFFDDEVTGSWFEFECSVPQEGDVPDFIPADWPASPGGDGPYGIPGTPGAPGSGKPATGSLPAGLSCSDHSALAQYYGVPSSPKNSPALDQLINCVYANLGSILGPKSNQPTIEQSPIVCNYVRGSDMCGTCEHRINSCHFGGKTGNNGAEAVDFNAADGTLTGELHLSRELERLKNQNICPINGILFENDHTHVTTKACDATY